MKALTASGSATLTSIAPQFLVDNLQRSIEYYRQHLGFELDFCYRAFYASVSRDGCAIHLKVAPQPVPTGLIAGNTSISTRTSMSATQLPCMTNCGHAGRLLRSLWKRDRGRAGTSTSKMRTATFSVLASGRPDMPLHLTATKTARACASRAVVSWRTPADARRAVRPFGMDED